MPFQGRKKRMNNALRFLGISMAFLLLSVGVSFQTQLKQVDTWRSDLRDHFEPEYRAVMLDQDALPETMRKAAGDLDRLRRRIDEETSGVGSGESVSSKLTLVLQALGTCAKQTDLKIKSIEIGNNNIVVNGDTSSRRHTNEVLDALESVLAVQGQRVRSDGTRDSFNFTLDVEKKPSAKKVARN
jgi:hypothetical protein